MKGPVTDRVDVIVIGGGHTGLVCASYLAAAGRKVLVLEARDRVSTAAGLPVHLSGSGSTLFVVASGPLEADLLARGIEEQTGLPAVAASACSGVESGEIEHPSG